MDTSFESFRSIHERAQEPGLKGCTTFRPSEITGSIRSAADTPCEKLCCSMDREAD